MNVAACQVLRHQPRVRHGLGVPAIWCNTCGIDFPLTESLDPPAPPRCAPPRRDQEADLADWAPGELVESFGK